MGKKQTTVGVYTPTKELLDGLKASGETWDRFLANLVLAASEDDLMSLRMETMNDDYEELIAQAAGQHDVDDAIDKLDSFADGSTTSGLATDGGH